jgi:DNA-binding PadR family transcriptional regulator
MRGPTFLVLSALASGRKHGYAIVKDVEEVGETLSVGTLYTALDRLAKAGLVRSAGEEVVDGRLRRYYDLTDDGAETLQSEADRQAAAAQRARTRLATRTADAR